MTDDQLSDHCQCTILMTRKNEILKELSDIDSKLLGFHKCEKCSAWYNIEKNTSKKYSIYKTTGYTYKDKSPIEVKYRVKYITCPSCSHKWFIDMNYIEDDDGTGN